MKAILNSAKVIFLAATISASFSGNVLAACVRETGDAGGWRDAQSPAGRIETMCRRGQREYRASRGRMVLVNMNSRDCRDLIRYAKKEQSWHGDWFLWSVIRCDRGMTLYLK